MSLKHEPASEPLKAQGPSRTCNESKEEEVPLSMAHIRQPGPDSGLGFQGKSPSHEKTGLKTGLGFKGKSPQNEKVLKTKFEGVPSSLESR